MHHYSASLEIIRWGNADVPGAIFWYANELDLSMEDIGVLSTIFYAFQKSKPLYQIGLKTGQVMQVCPLISKNKFSRNISRLEKLGIISITEKNKSFNDREIHLEPLMEKLTSLVARDHYQLSDSNFMVVENASNSEILNSRIEQLEMQLEEERRKTINFDFSTGTNKNYKKVADFISKKTGNLMSIKMSTELKRWLEEMKYTPEFLLCILEMCFERNIYNPRDISKIAKDLNEYSINTVEGLELYFKNYVDTNLNSNKITSQFDPEAIEFGNFTGIDMSAEARKAVYYKWRYDWGFSHSMVMKAGEIMCQRTKNGGLEYVDSVLANWKAKNIRQVEEAQKEILEFKNKNKKSDFNTVNYKKPVSTMSDYEIFVAPVIDDANSK
ncbi:MAG: DnaD domain protein [Syntrophomonadaceae bacterium]|jgi:hypothetical protein|nr:DnaD domain protein [Syntrophomonadaceae bacterium]